MAWHYLLTTSLIILQKFYSDGNYSIFVYLKTNKIQFIISKIDYNLISDTLFENESLQIHKLLKNHHRLHHHHNLRHQLGHLGRKRGGIREVIHKLSNKKMYFRLNLSFLNLFGGTECNKYPKWHEFEARRFTDRGSADQHTLNMLITCSLTCILSLLLTK